MQIRAVELDNTKSYDHARIEFTDGVNAIVGHNGAGKSTILEAIGLALFDALDYTRSEFVRSGTRTATMTVEVESNLDGRPYHIVRRMGGSNQHYVFDPELDLRICEGKVDVLAFLRQHMGVDGRADLKALFKDAVGVPQGMFTAAFLLSAAPRKKVFDSLLQVEDYQQAFDRLREPLRLLETQAQKLDVSVAGLQARLEQLPGLEAAVSARRTEIERVAVTAREAQGLLNAAVARRDVLDAVRNELAALQSKQAQATQRQEGMARQLAAARQALAEAEAAHTIVEEHREGSRRYVAAQEEQKRLDARLRERTRLEAERAAGDKATALAEGDLTRLQHDLDESEAARATAEGLRGAVEVQAQLENLLTAARQEAARLQDAQTAVTRRQQSLDRLLARREALAADAARTTALEAQRAGIQAEIEELLRSIDRLKENDAGLRAEGQKVKEHSAALQNVETALCPVCEQPLSEGHRHEMMARNDRHLESLRVQFREVKDGITQAQVQLASRQQELAATEKALRSVPRPGEVEEAGREVEAGQAELAELRAQEAQLAGAPARSEALAAQLEELGDPRRRYAIAWERAQQAERVQQEMRKTKSAIDERRQKLAGIQAQLAQYAEVDTALDAVNAEIRLHADAYQAVLSHHRVAETVEPRRAEVAQLQAAREEGQAELERLAAQLEQVEARFDADAYRQAVSEEQDLRGRIGGMRAQQEMLAQQQAGDEQAIVQLKRLSATLAAAQAEQHAVAEQTAMLETVRSMLRQAGPYITSVLIRQISDNARQIFGDIMQDHSRHLAWNEDYGITLEVDGHERQFEQLSGGEQMTAALAVRLALLRELSSIDVAFFDEPTANLDEMRRESLARRILEIKGFRQLFVISHDDTFEQATQNLIRVERVNGISQIVEG